MSAREQERVTARALILGMIGVGVSFAALALCLVLAPFAWLFERAR